MATAAQTLTKGERTRIRLLEAAEAVFGSRGYHAASISDITRAADVAMGTFYVYFPAKLDVLTELVRTRGHELRVELHEATTHLRSRAEVERVGLVTFLDWVRRHPDIYRVVRNAEFVDVSVFQEWYRKLGQEYVRGLRKAMGSGQIATGDPEAVAYCLMAVADFVGMRYVLWEPDKKIPQNVLDTVLNFMLRGLGADNANGTARKS